MSIDVSYVVRELRRPGKEIGKTKVKLNPTADASQLVAHILHEHKIMLVGVDSLSLRVFRPGTTESDWVTPDDQKTDARLEPEDTLAPYIPGPEVTDKEQRRFNVLIVQASYSSLGSQNRSQHPALLLKCRSLCPSEQMTNSRFPHSLSSRCVALSASVCVSVSI